MLQVKIKFGLKLFILILQHHLLNTVTLIIHELGLEDKGNQE